MKTAAATLFLILVSAGAGAQPVYRCGSEYSQSPCPQGRVVDVADPRTDAQRADRQRVLADERRLTEELRRERLADEARLTPNVAWRSSAPAAVVAKPAPAKPPSRPMKIRVSVKPPPAELPFAAAPSSRAPRQKK